MKKCDSSSIAPPHQLAKLLSRDCTESGLLSLPRYKFTFSPIGVGVKKKVALRSGWAVGARRLGGGRGVRRDLVPDLQAIIATAYLGIRWRHQDLVEPLVAVRTLFHVASVAEVVIDDSKKISITSVICQCGYGLCYTQFMVTKQRSAVITTLLIITLIGVVSRRTKIHPTQTNVTNAGADNVNLRHTNTSSAAPANTEVEPIANFFSRITKKPFGIYITPQTSPIQPEKFTGYHTGADAETTSTEAKIDVPIMAVADGTVVFAGHVNGYGGVIIIRNKFGKETVTTLYGHLRITSFTKKTNDAVKRGEKIAVLGNGFTSETDGERKHLHFGVVKGSTINFKGYVQTKSALSAWEDPVAWLTQHHNE